MLAWQATPASGEVLSDSLSRDLDEVEVSASRIDKVTIPAQELDGAQLRRLSAYSVADALRYFSGVQIKDYGGIGGLKTVNVRSMGSEHVGVFYDGIQLGNAQNGTIDLGRFSLENMESITMYNGQKSSIFQSAKSYASASAIYLQSRRPVFDVVEEGDDLGVRYKPYNIKAGLKYGSFDTWNPSLLWEQRLGEHLGSSLSAEYVSTSGEYDFRLRRVGGYDTVMTRTNGDVRAVRVEAGLYGNTAKDIWTAKIYFYNSERGYPGAVVREIPGRFANRDRQWDTDLFVQGNWQRSVNDWYSVQAQLKYAYDYLHYKSDPQMDVSTIYVDNVYRQHEAYASAVQLFALKSWWSASVSTDFQMNYLDGNMSDFSKPVRYTALVAASTAFEWNRLKGQASALFSYIDDKADKGCMEGTRNKLTPAVTVSWQPFEDYDWNVRAFYKKVFRVPTLNDIYYTIVGARPLNPEYTTQYDVGTTWAVSRPDGLPGRLELQADAYFNQVDDKIVAMPASNQFRWTMMNIGRVRIFGVDAALQSNWRLAQTGHGLRLSYTYQKAQDRTESTSPWYGGQIPYIPMHSGSVVYSGEWRGWSWNYSFIYTGERYISVANIPENYEQPWYTHDLGVARRFDLRGCSLRASLEVNNLFNQQYEVIRCYPMSGTNFKLRIEVSL